MAADPAKEGSEGPARVALPPKAAEPMSIFLAALLSCSMCEGTPDPEHDEYSNQDADEAAYQGTDEQGSHYIFKGDELTGEVLTPEGQLIPWRRPVKSGSLISVRPHFLPELIRLATDVG
jgi:hypothetical protein